MMVAGTWGAAWGLAQRLLAAGSPLDLAAFHRLCDLKPKYILSIQHCNAALRAPCMADLGRCMAQAGVCALLGPIQPHTPAGTLLRSS